MSEHAKPSLGESPTAKRKVLPQTIEVDVGWDHFFALAMNGENWAEVALDSDQMDGRMCKSFGHGCTWSDLPEGSCESTFRLFKFDTTDKFFDGEFVLCEYCVETGLSEYIEWWLADMADDYKTTNVDETLSVDVQSLSKEDREEILRFKQVKSTD